MLALALMLGTVAPPAQDLDRARKFVQSIYARYGSTQAVDPNYLGVDGKAVFSPSLYRLIKHDAETTPQGFVGRLDFDPICLCQDPDGLRVETVTLYRVKQPFVVSKVSHRYSDSTTRLVRLTLVPTKGGWRIDEISGTTMPSLRLLLRPSPRKTAIR
jgi:hypothetical protein